MGFFEQINPESLGPPRGYSNGLVAPVGARLLFVAGQIAWNDQQQIVSDGFAAQFGQALENVMTVVRAAGGRAEHLAQLTIFVTDKQAYLADLAGVGRAYRQVMAKHYPTMALVEVASLLDPAAQVEIQGMACLPVET